VFVRTVTYESKLQSRTGEFNESKAEGALVPEPLIVGRHATMCAEQIAYNQLK